MAKLTLEKLFANAQQRIVNEMIRHAIYTEQLKDGMAVDLRKFWEDNITLPLLALTSRTFRQNQILQSSERIIKSATQGLAATFKNQITKLGKTEVEWAGALLEKFAPINFSSRLPSTATVKALAETPVLGNTLDKWFDNLGQATSFKVRGAITQGLLQGEGVGTLANRIKPLTDQGKKSAEAIVRTAANAVGNESRSAVYQENADIVKGEKWISTLDGRTTPICIQRDGQLYPLGEGPRPPAHINCRSVTIPELRSWKELGINGIEDIPPKKRAALGGPVDATTTYPEWLKKQPPEFQDRVLGKEKGRLFRESKFTPTKFVNESGKTLTIAEFREANGLGVATKTPKPKPTKADPTPKVPKVKTPKKDLKNELDNTFVTIPSGITPKEAGQIIVDAAKEAGIPLPSVMKPPVYQPVPTWKPPVNPPKPPPPVVVKTPPLPPPTPVVQPVPTPPTPPPSVQPVTSPFPKPLGVTTVTDLVRERDEITPFGGGSGFVSLFRSWVETLSARQKSIISEWSKVSYKEIRAVDRGVASAGEFARSLYNTFMSSFGNAPRVSGRFYRGLSLTEADYARLISGSYYELNAVSSFSRSKLQAFKFVFAGGNPRRVFLDFETRSAVPIEQLSKLPHEREVLIFKGQRFRIVRIETNYQIEGEFGTATRIVGVEI